MRTNKKILFSLGAIAFAGTPIAMSSCGIQAPPPNIDPGPLPPNIDPGPLHTNFIKYINETKTGSDKSEDKLFIPNNPQDGVNFDHKYSGWYDGGFSWYELLNRPWYSAPGVPTQETYIQNVLKHQKMMNIGFITAMDLKRVNDKAKTEPNNGYVKLLLDEHKANPNWILPSVGGVLSPQIYSNSYNWDHKKTTNMLKSIRDNSGDFKISFGGYNDYSLASKIVLQNKDDTTQLNELTQLYKSIIDMSNAKYIDFDIEGLENGRSDDYGHTPLTETQGIKAKKLRINALKKIKEMYPWVKITFTIPTDIGDLGGLQGYTSEQMIKDALSAKIINTVNLMSFDFGAQFNVSSYPRLTAPGEMALYAISSANKLEQLFTNTGMSNEAARKATSITIMNGRNDVRYQVDWATDAKIITNWAIKQNIGNLSNWSVNRDLSQFARDDFSKQMGEYPAGYRPQDHIWTEPLTIDQLMNYTQTSTDKTITVKGQTYSINAAMTDQVGTKDFVYGDILNHFSTKQPLTLDTNVFNTHFWSSANSLGIDNINKIENYSGTINHSINYVFDKTHTLAIYNGFINNERKGAEYFAANPTL